VCRAELPGAAVSVAANAAPALPGDAVRCLGTRETIGWCELCEEMVVVVVVVSQYRSLTYAFQI
jgi:hypothetical protein